MITRTKGMLLSSWDAPPAPSLPQAQALSSSPALPCPGANPSCFNPKNTQVAQSGLWRKQNKSQTKRKKKKPTHTQFVLFMFQESHIHSRHQSFCQLSLCFNLSSWASFLQEGKQTQHTGKLDVLSKIFIQAAQSN